MFFNKICVIGTGLIGGSLIMSFKRVGIGQKFVGVDIAQTLEFAKQHGIIDKGYLPDEIKAAVQDADLIIFATAINRILDYIPEIAKYTKPGALVTDVGSTKELILKKATECFKKDVFFVGGHPMTGSEKNSIEAADPFLFENSFYILCPMENSQPEVVKKLIGCLEMIGAKVLVMDAKTHDRIAAGVSHLPQMMAVSLVNMIEKYNIDQPNFLKLAAGGFRDMTRIASSPFNMWEDICETNEQNILDFIDDFQNELNRFKSFIKEKKLKKEFTRAAKTRLSIPQDTKGFINPNFDVTVVVEDQPGVIARIATTLACENINIRDIEVLKVRLLEGGTFRLSFGSENNRERALELLKKEGFDCRKR